MTWQPTPTLVFTRDPGRTTVEYIAPEPVDLSRLIACITCRATVTQSCRVVTGKLKGREKDDHTLRLVKRLCPCGARLAPRHQLCATCAAETIRIAKRDYMRRRRAVA